MNHSNRITTKDHVVRCLLRGPKTKDEILSEVYNVNENSSGNFRFSCDVKLKTALRRLRRDRYGITYENGRYVLDYPADSLTRRLKGSIGLKAFYGDAIAQFTKQKLGVQNAVVS